MTVKDIMDRVPASRAGFVYAHELGSVELLRAKDTPGTLAREVKTISWATDEAGQNVELWLTMQPASTEPLPEADGHAELAAMTGGALTALMLTLALLVLPACGAAYRIGRHIGFRKRERVEKYVRGDAVSAGDGRRAGKHMTNTR